MNTHIGRTMILALLLPAAAWAAKPVTPDRDQDGVRDADDLCPYTQSKVAVDAQGCTLDSDFDGVADGGDACPYSKFGAPVNAEGCSREERGAKPALAAAPVAEPAPVVAQTAPAAALQIPEPPPLASAATEAEATPPPAPPPAVVSPILPSATVAVPKPKKPAPRRVVSAPIGGGFANSLPPPPMAPELPVEEPPAAAAVTPPPPAPVVAEKPALPEVAAAPPAPAAPAAPVEAATLAEAAPDAIDAAATPAEAADDDHAELLPLLNDENALLSAIDRRNQERAAAEERESRTRLSHMLDDRATEGAAAPAPRTRARVAPAPAPKPPVRVARPAPPPPPPAPPAPTVLPRNKERLLADVPFAANRSDIASAAVKGLAGLIPDLSHIMERLPTLRVEVVGHADAATEGAKAEKLAAERAMAVNAYLIGRGVPPSRIKRINRADSAPLVSGSGAGNRVVEIYTYPQ